MSEGNQLVKSVCGVCRSCCGVLIHRSGGKVTKIEMDADKGAAEYLLHLKPMSGESDPDFYRRLGNTVDYRIPDNAEFH